MSTNDFSDSSQSWSPCFLASNEKRIRSTWKTFEISHFLDVNSLARFCEVNDIDTSRVIQAAWAVVLGAYANSDAPCSKFITPSRASSLVYRCSLNDEDSVLSMIRGIEEKTWTQTRKISDNESSASPSAPFDTSLSVVLTGEEMVYNEATEVEDPIVLNASVLVPSRILRVSYAEPLVSELQASMIAKCLKKTIQEMISQKSHLIGDLDIISEEDHATIVEWNSEEPLYSDSCIHQVVQKRAQASPDDPAVCSWDAKYSYSELDNLASRLAQHLRDLGVRKGARVPFLFHKSAYAIVAVLATLKAGGVSFALNADFPTERLMALFNSTGAELILAGADCTNLLGEHAVKTLVVDDALLSGPPSSSIDVDEHTSPDDAALIVFTSGSTGNPKGIVFEHRQYCSYALAHHKAHYLDEKSRHLQFSSHNFDSYFADTLSTLMAGGCVCIPPEESRLTDLAGVISSMKVTSMFMTPTLAHILKPSQVPTLKVLVIGGESAVQDVIDLWADHVTLVNTYGPAECCPDAVYHNFTTGKRDCRKIGKALRSATLWIIRPDNCRLLAPIGTVGELVIQGPTVARGYLNLPKETEAAFIESLHWQRHDGKQHWRSYRTGDLVRYAPDGSLEFIGRKDRQIKLRGQRIELGEIEHHLKTVLPDGTLIAVEVTAKDALVAFRTQNGTSSHHQSQRNILLHATDDIREENSRVINELSKLLPGYMVPLIHLPVHIMPTTPSDKIDRKALRRTVDSMSDSDFSAYSLSSVETEGPLTATEVVLRDLWCEVLAVEADSITKASNFIYLGGSSITAMRLASLTREHGISLQLADILRNPQLAAMASVSKNLDNGNDNGPENMKRNVDKLLEQFQPLPFPVSNIEDAAYATPYQVSNIGWSQLKKRGGTNYVTCDFEKHVSASQLLLACNRLVAHHSALRTVFVIRNRQVLQVILKHISLDVVYHCNGGSVEEATLSIIEDDLSQPINVLKPIVRFFFILKGDKVQRLVLRASHAQYDGPSLNRMYADIVSAYLGNSLPPSIPLTHYMPWAANRNETQAENFWRELLSGSTITNVMNHSRPPTQNVLACSVSTCIPTNIARPHSDITVATTMKAAWAAVLAEISGQTDLVFGAVNWGRTAPVSNAESVDGPCSDILPVRVRFGSEMTNLDLLKQIQDQYLSGIPYECYGFRKIVENCTDWPLWSRLNTCVEYQNLAFEEADSLNLHGGKVICDEIRPPADRHDIFLFITPVSDTETLIVIDTCENLFPRAFVQDLLDRLCFYIRKFYTDVDAPLNSAIEATNLPNGEREIPSGKKTRKSPPKLVPQLFEFTDIDGSLDDSRNEFSVDSLTGVLRRPQFHPILYENPRDSQTAKIPKLVLRVWGCILGCQRDDILCLLENDTPWFEVWGELVAAAGLAETYHRLGFKGSMEEMLEFPTISSQISLITGHSWRLKRVGWKDRTLLPVISKL